ncbi:MAG: putative Ig domain-containing protein, partial [Terracidiphilus sp.]
MVRKTLVLASISLFAALCLSGCGGSSAPISVTVNASVTTVDGTDTVKLTATVTNDQNAAGVTWSVTGGGTLSGETSTSATYTAPAAGSSAQTITITATSVANTSESGTISLTIPATLSITSTGGVSGSLAGQVGTAYSVQLSASGGISPYTWTITSGALPSCLSMTSGGLITGTPTASCSGTFTITFQVTDSGTPTSLSATLQLTLVIAAAPPITFTGNMPATGTFGTAYTGSAAATGGAGTLTYSATGLPAWLTLNTATGAVTGTPATAAAVGKFTFTVTATDTFGDSATSPQYTITVGYPLVTIAPVGGALPVAYANAAYSTTLVAAGGSGTGYIWSATGLPSWLSIAPATGVLSGRPTAAASAASFTVNVTDSANNTASGRYSVTVDPGVSISPSGGALPVAYANAAYSTTLTASGGSGTGYTWSATGLPAWLSISSSTGALTGTPTAAAAAANFTVMVTDSLGNTGSASYAVTVLAGISIAPSGGALPAAFANAPYSTTLVATGGSGTGYSWSATGLPAWLSINSTTGALTGTPTAAASAASFTVNVTDSAHNTASGSYSVTVNTGVGITPSGGALPTAYVGANYSETLAAAGGSGTGYKFALASGSSLPSWLTLSQAGVLSGTPTAAANSVSFTVKVTDSDNNTGSATLSITVDAGISIAPSGGALAVAYVGSAYSATLTASGGSGTGYTWSATGLPAWLSISSSTGALTGTPTAAATAASFTVKVTDSAHNTASGGYSVTVLAGISIAPSGGALPAAFANAPYSTILVASGGSGTGYSWSATGLPAWLSINSTTGALTGTPTAAASAASFTVNVTDSAHNTASGSYSITVNTGIGITPSGGALPTAYVGANYSTTLTASGGSGGGYKFAVASGSSLPGWLSLSQAGVLSGTPTAAAPAASFTVRVTDSASNTGSATFSVTVDAGVSISPSGGALAAAYVGSLYSTTLTASGGSGTGYSWSATGLPAWLSISPTTGALTGTPAAAATAASFTVKVTDSANNTASGSYSVTVDAGISISPAGGALAGAFVNTAYTATLSASGGSGGYSWSATGLPAWLSISPTSGALTGTPTATASAASFTVNVTDSAHNTASASYSITVSAGISITPASGALPLAYVNALYSSGTLTASGGSGTGYTWSVSSGALPSWLSLNTTTGATNKLTGTPTVAASAVSFTLKVTDSVGNSATVAYSVTVDAGISISPSSGSLATAYVGLGYSAGLSATGGSGTGYSWTANGLPAWLSISPTTGALTGTPTAVAAAANFTVKVTDSANNTASASYSVTVDAGISITPSGGALTNGYAGTAYSATFTPSGGSGTGYSWTVTAGGSQLGALGLTFNTSTGVLSGTPSSVVAGNATFTVKVTDSLGNTQSGTYTLTIEAKLGISTTSPLPSGVATTNYSDTLNATGGTGAGTYTWSVTSGATGANSLQSVGLSLSSAGVLSGTTSTLVAGTATFGVQVADTASHTATATFTVTINASLYITTTTLPNAFTGTTYTQTLMASGGTGGNTWSVTINPTGLTALGLSLSSGGVLSGTGSGLVVGSATFTAQVKDSSGDTATQQLTINVYNPLTLPASGTLAAATTNTLYGASVTASGGSGSGYVFTVNGTQIPTNNSQVLIADGISVSNAGNNLLVISGTPTLTQTVTLTDVTVKDGAGDNAGPDTYTIVVSPPTPLTLPGSEALQSATTNDVYNSSITANGGSGSGYVFTVNGTQIPTTGTTGAVLISDGISVYST